MKKSAVRRFESAENPTTPRPTTTRQVGVPKPESKCIQDCWSASVWKGQSASSLRPVWRRASLLLSKFSSQRNAKICGVQNCIKISLVRDSQQDFPDFLRCIGAHLSQGWGQEARNVSLSPVRKAEVTYSHLQSRTGSGSALSSFWLA